MNGKILISTVILMGLAHLLETKRLKRQDTISDITDRGVKCVTKDSGQAGECLDITHCDEASKISAANQARFIEQRACKPEVGTVNFICCVIDGQSPTAPTIPNRTRPLAQPDRSAFQPMTQAQLSQVCGVGGGLARVPVVGRLLASVGQFPWMAAIFVGKELNVVKCGGVLINEQYVLTAAQCVVDKTTGLKRNASEYTVRLGALNISNNTDISTAEDFTVSQLIPHEAYDPATLTNDIALIQLDRPTTSFAPICLPTPSLMASTSLDNRKCVMCGWGRDSAGPAGGLASTALSYVSLDVLSNPSCQTTFRRFTVTITDSHLCAGLASTGNDACLGDEGGPLMLFDVDRDSWYSVGVKTVDFKCGQPVFPDIFTKTTAHLDWINNNANII